MKKINWPIDRWIAVVGVLIGVIACIGTYLALPQIQAFFTQTPTRVVASGPPPALSSIMPSAQAPTPAGNNSPTPILITVESNTQQGIKYTIPRTGTYRITYQGGSYDIGEKTTCGPRWRTQVNVYTPSEKIEWHGTEQCYEPYPSSFAVGCIGDKQPEDQAGQEACARGVSFPASFDAGDTLTFLVLDGIGSFANNKGNVQVTVQEEPGH